MPATMPDVAEGLAEPSLLGHCSTYQELGSSSLQRGQLEHGKSVRACVVFLQQHTSSQRQRTGSLSMDTAAEAPHLTM